MFDFQHSHLTQSEFEKVVTIILDYRQVYATTKFDVGKTYKERCNFQKTKNKQSTDTLKRTNPETTGRTKKIHHCTSEQRTTIYRKYFYKSSNYITKGRIIKNSTRCTIFK